MTQKETGAADVTLDLLAIQSKAVEAIRDYSVIAQRGERGRREPSAVRPVATGMTWARYLPAPDPRLAVLPWQAWPAVAQAARTWVACGSFGPWATSNSTCWFSSRLRKP